MRCEVEKQSVVTQDSKLKFSPVESIRYLFGSGKLISIVKALVEQGLSSFGSFLFFFILARGLKSERFGQFSAIWTSIQVMTSIAMARIYLPITSMTVLQHEENCLYGVCLYRLIRLFYLFPVILGVALYFTAKEILILPSVLISTISLCMVVMTVDFLRYYLIRRGHKVGTAVLVTVRWAGGILLVLFFLRLQTLTVKIAVSCMLSGNILALIITGIVVKKLQCDIRLTRDKELGHKMSQFSNPLLFQTFSGSASGVIVAFAMRSWISTAAFGAYQALRSLCNVISPLMQVINTHYSSYLTRRPYFAQHRTIEPLLMIIGGLTVCISWHFKDGIIAHTIGSSYLPYSFLLPVIMFQTFVMLTNNLIGAHIRRSGNTKVFAYYGLVGLMGSSLLIPVAKYSNSIQLVVGVVILGTVMQFSLLKVFQLRTGKQNVLKVSSSASDPA